MDFWDGKSRRVWMIWDFQNETKHKKLGIWVSPFMESLIVKKVGYEDPAATIFGVSKVLGPIAY